MVLNAEDVLDVLGIEESRITINVREEERSSSINNPLEAALSSHPIHVDELVRKTKEPTHIVSAKLSALEIQGKVKHIGGGRYVRTQHSKSEI